MEKQVKTINVDELWSRKGNESCCTEYVYYAKVKRKYLNYIINNIEELSIDLLHNKNFTNSKLLNERRIYYIVRSIDRFKVHDLKKLLDKEYSITDFLNKANGIRETNIEIFAQRSRD